MAAAHPSQQSQQTSDGAAPNLTVHHLENSRCHRILWLLEELELPYTLKQYKLERGENGIPHAPDELKAIHPLGKSPIITDGNVALAESGAIVEYIIKKYGNGRADAPPSGAIDDLYFTHYAEGSFAPPVLNKIVFTVVPGLAELKSQLVDPQVQRHVEFVEAHLAKSGDWFAGGDHPTAADYMMLFTLEVLHAADSTLIGPKTRAYLERAQARPAYKRATEKGGKLELKGF